MSRSGAPMLQVPRLRMSGLAVPMTKASALSVTTPRTSNHSEAIPKSPRVRGNSVVSATLRDPASFMGDVEKAAEAGIEGMDALMTVLNKPDRGGTRISYTNMTKHIFPKSTYDLIREAHNDSTAGRLAVCVVENISPSLIKALGAAWDLEPEFFAMHATNPPTKELWRQFSEWSPNDKDALTSFDHLDGIYEFHDMDLSVELMQRSSNNYFQRHIFKDGHWPVNVTTKISYMRVSATLYLFLVDPPVRYEHAIRGEVPDRAMPTMRFPYAQNKGGVLLPSPALGRHFVPFTALERIFRHAWQLELLFHPEELFPSVPFLYLMSFSLWYSRLHKLDKEIKRISFNDIRNPDLGILQTLHDLREDLSTLKDAVNNTQYYASHGIMKFYRELWDEFPYNNMFTPLDGHEAISKNAYQLHQFLLETFQLLMNTITSRDSQLSVQQTHESLKQTRQSVILTRLAAFYLPWTLASGIYGMNLQQLNGSGLPIWTFVVTGVLLVLGTVLMFQMQASAWQPATYMMYFRRSYWRSRRQREIEEIDS